MSRTFTLASAIAAVAALSFFRGLAWLNVITALAFAVSAVGVRIWPSIGPRASLMPVYLTPALFVALTGANHYSYVVVWMAAVLGLACGTSLRAEWSFPKGWRWPLAIWALTVAASWPIVAAREMDFTLATLFDPRLPVAGAKIATSGSVHWISYIAGGQLVGLLWFDWLFATFPSAAGRTRFTREVVAPLAVGALCSCVVGIYQAFVDLGFLSGHAWPSLNRAAGTLMDANIFGMIAALWVPAFLALAASSNSRAWFLGCLIAFVVAGLGVWASGSRTAGLVALGGTLIGLASLLRALPTQGHRRQLLGAAALATAVFAVAIALVPSQTVNAFQRGRYLIPEMSTASLRKVASTLWEREGYGTASVAMIREFPYLGVGVGGYNTLSHDFALESAGLDIPPDNAQNWFRQQLAELGIIGSIGWIFWICAFTTALWPGRPDRGRPESGLRGPLIAFGLASLVGMPAQDPAVVLTFWTLVFWFAVDRDGTRADRPVSTRALMAIAALIAVYSVARVGQTGLRPPFRAARFSFPYTYGMQVDVAGNKAQLKSQGVTVLSAPSEWLKLTFWLDGAADLERDPPHVDVWVNRDHVVNQRLSGRQRATRYIRVGQGKRFVLRGRLLGDSFYSNASGANDLLGIAWDFVQSPPR